MKVDKSKRDKLKSDKSEIDESKLVVSDIVIRPVDLDSQIELEQIVDLQVEGWNLGEEDILTPELLKICGNNGLVVGAFANDDAISNSDNPFLVGYALGFFSNNSGLVNSVNDFIEFGGNVPAHIDKEFAVYAQRCDRDVFYSHMVATRKSLRGKGIGALLKSFQRDECASLGMGVIEWTYDPLISRNGKLNLNKLGAKVPAPKNYVRDYYGEISGDYKGLPTDRFIVTWDTSKKNQPPSSSKTSFDKYVSDGAKVISSTSARLLTLSPEFLGQPEQKNKSPQSGLVYCRELKEFDLDQTADTILFEVPLNFNESDFIAADASLDSPVRLDWRTKSRAVFETYLERGYQVVDLVLKKHETQLDPFNGNGLRPFYVMQKS
ncbi:hypothetical protein HN587_02945 [Candidatus Woesearchaeota archaeon]|nr:hypothetical protein [Candidatus Woesearchaeota archaeon]